jgi:hypothetical protein
MNTILDLSAIHPGEETHDDEPPHVEIARLREDVADLRASAVRWRELYENAVRRAEDIEDARELRQWHYIDRLGKLLRDVRSAVRRALRAKSR